MKINIVHTCSGQQPVAATVAAKIYQSLPEGEAVANCVDKAAPAEDDLVLAVFSLRAGSFAPTVACYRELRDKKVAFVAILTGPVDQARVRKTIWAIKKQFCGNYVVGGYLCPAESDEPWGLPAAELTKVLAYARRLYDEHLAPEEGALAVNY